MDTDPKPYHLYAMTAAGGLLGAIAGLLAALGHPLSAEIHEAILGLIGSVAFTAGLVLTLVRADREQKPTLDRAAVIEIVGEQLRGVAEGVASAPAPEHLARTIREALDEEDRASEVETPSVEAGSDS